MKLRNISTLQLALGASLVIHGAVLTVRFVNPELTQRVFEDTPLEVILVNARSKEKPDKPQAIAQASLAGGGEADAGRSSNPLPAADVTNSILIQAPQVPVNLQSMLEQQNQLLLQKKKELAALAVPGHDQPTDKQSQVEQEERRKQLNKLLAEIEQRIHAENARPKKRYISPSVREEVYAVYYDTFRRTIEARGTDNFPTAGGQKLYGELTMVVTINHDGRVLATDVKESSGNAVLDRRAIAIVRSVGVFDAFTAAMRKEADQISVVSRFKFTRGGTLETDMAAPP